MATSRNHQLRAIANWVNLSTPLGFAVALQEARVRVEVRPACGSPKAIVWDFRLPGRSPSAAW